MTNSIKFEIISELEMDHKWLSGEALSPLGGCSDDGTERGLGDWQYQLIVDVTANGETRRFTVDFQPVERSNGMRNYCGYEVTTAAKYGCDSDESHELLEFCEDDESVLDQLQGIAEAALMASLEMALKCRGIQPLYSFTERCSVEQTLADGSIQKTAVFRHAGWVEA